MIQCKNASALVGSDMPNELLFCSTALVTVGKDVVMRNGSISISSRKLLSVRRIIRLSINNRQYAHSEMAQDGLSAYEFERHLLNLRSVLTTSCCTVWNPQILNRK